MARQSFAQSQIPSGIAEIPYPSHRQAVAMARHVGETFVGTILGAGGVGGALAGIPFEPAMIDLHEPVGPVMQRHLPAVGGTSIEVNLITGAASASPIVVTKVGATWTVTAPVALVANGRTATLLIHAFRDIDGSL